MSGLPKVTVLMPVYNGEKYLREAIASILNQTFSDFELLIIDDGSTDGSADIIESYGDRRIRPIPNTENRGIIASLNKGIELARGDYIARMDADDISLPRRLEKQVKFMISRPDVGACGSWVEVFGKKETWRYPTDNEHIKCRLLFNSVIAHPSVIMSKDVIKKSGLLYSPDCRRAEDYDFWVRISRHAAVANIGEVLVRYRLHPDQTGRQHGQEQKHVAGRIRLKQLRELGIDPSEEEFDTHEAVSCYEFKPDKDFVNRTHAWFQKLLRANEVSAVYAEPAFSEVIALNWAYVCNGARSLGLWSVSKFLGSPFRRYYPKTVWDYFLSSKRAAQS